MIVSLVIFSTVTAFAIKQYQVMMNYEDTKHQSNLSVGQADLRKGVSLENFHFAFSNLNRAGVYTDLNGAF